MTVDCVVKIKRFLISCFAVLNIFTVLFMNRPESFSVSVNAWLEKKVSTGMTYRFRYAAWLLAHYAHVVGLDNRWQMFSWMPRFNWQYLIQARYDNGQRLVLPLFQQSQRSFGEKWFYDFKEAKFHLNIYLDPGGRESYARYLCRQYPRHEDSTIRSILWEVHYQNILEPSEVRRGTDYLEPLVTSTVLNEFACPSRGQESA